MLATIITILILGGGSVTGVLFDFGDIKKGAKAHIVEDERKEAALDVVKAAKVRAKAEKKRYKSLEKELNNALLEQATDEQLAYLGQEYLDNMKVYYHDLLGFRYELKEQFTRDEWTAAFAEIEPK